MFGAGGALDPRVKPAMTSGGWGAIMGKLLIVTLAPDAKAQR